MGKGSGRGRLPDRPPPRKQAVSYGPFIGVLTDVVKKGRERGGLGDRMPRLTALAEIHSREKIPAWHLYNSTRVDEDAHDARALIMDNLLLQPNKPVTTSMATFLRDSV